MKIVDNPVAAAEHCTAYMPDCSPIDEKDPGLVVPPEQRPAGIGPDGTQIGPIQVNSV